MKGDPIPDSGHVARYCRPGTIDRGDIQAAAFLPRQSDTYLSVNWLEDLARPDRRSEISELQRIFAAKMKSIGASAKFAVLNVGEILTNVLQESSDGRQLSVTHEPVSDDHSHAGINSFRHQDMEIAELILQLIQETHPARG